MNFNVISFHCGKNVQTFFIIIIKERRKYFMHAILKLFMTQKSTNKKME